MTLTKMLTQKEITEGNEKIAKFIGWFQDEVQSLFGSSTWYEINGSAKYVAYSIQSNYPHLDLPFHRDWNYLMKAVVKLEDLGFCVHSANYSKAKDVKNNLADHIGFNMLEDYYTDISGSVQEDGTTRYFQIQRLDVESRLEALWRTIVMFLEYYQDKTVRIVNISNNEINRVERK